MIADEDALNARFASGMDADALQISVDNQITSDSLNKTKLYCHWSIEAGDSQLATFDGKDITLGVAMLKVVAPSQTYTDAAWKVRDQFFALFRGWRSDDGCVRVYKFGQNAIPVDVGYQAVYRIYWESLRKR